MSDIEMLWRRRLLQFQLDETKEISNVIFDKIDRAYSMTKTEPQITSSQLKDYADLAQRYAAMKTQRKLIKGMKISVEPITLEVDVIRDSSMGKRFVNAIAGCPFGIGGGRCQLMPYRGWMMTWYSKYYPKEERQNLEESGYFRCPLKEGIRSSYCPIKSTYVEKTTSEQSLEQDTKNIVLDAVKETLDKVEEVLA